MRIYYNPTLKTKARKLRNQSTLSEILLWQVLKTKIGGYTFNRQKPLLNYIVDFYCQKLQLVIEIDGDSHDYKGDYDEVRQIRLEQVGLHFLRFADNEVKRNLEGVEQAVQEYIKSQRNKVCKKQSC